MSMPRTSSRTTRHGEAVTTFSPTQDQQRRFHGRFSRDPGAGGTLEQSLFHRENGASRWNDRTIRIVERWNTGTAYGHTHARARASGVVFHCSIVPGGEFWSDFRDLAWNGDWNTRCSSVPAIKNGVDNGR